MKCPKCNSIISDSCKFCTNCGARLNEVSLNSGNKTDGPSNKSFGTTDKIPNVEKQTVLSEHHLEIAGDNNVAQWTIGRSEIARKISEIDFINIGTISAIIIQPGVTAVIYIDGKEILQLNSGIYRFISDDDASRTVAEATQNGSGIVGWLKAKLKSFVKLFLSKNNNNNGSLIERERAVPGIVSSIKENSLIAVYLKRDLNFPSYFGSMETGDGNRVFAPIDVRTKLYDAKVGVHMFLKISDFQEFIRGYLASRKFVTISDVQNDLSVYVRNVLQEELKYEEINEYGISDESKSRICSRLQEVAKYAPGIELVRVAEITCSNEAIDRFRTLSQELYSNEKELDFLHRTNEFRNRLARENNAVAIANANNDVELHNALLGVNRDKLLNEDEFESFVDALKIKKLKREASSAITAMDIKETLKQSEIKARTSTILSELDNQSRISEMVYAKELRDLQFLKDKKRAEIEIQREHDKYVDERESHSLDVKKRQIDMAMEIRERMMRQEHENKDRDYAREQDALDKEHAREQDSLNRSHMRNMEIMAQSREIKKDSYLHEENMANIRKGYSEGQIMAEQLSSLDAGAQMEFAKSLSSKKEEELAKAKQQMMDDYMKMMVSDRDKMLDFARDAMKMNVAAAGAQISNAETLRDKYKEDADRYREDAYHQQSRVDQNQDKALDYTTRVTTADVNVENNSNKGSVGNSKNVIYCPYCNSENDPENNVCGECGYRLK